MTHDISALRVRMQILCAGIESVRVAIAGSACMHKSTDLHSIHLLTSRCTKRFLSRVIVYECNNGYVCTRDHDSKGSKAWVNHMTVAEDHAQRLGQCCAQHIISTDCSDNQSHRATEKEAADNSIAASYLTCR
jgi:hypothetical protein